MQQVNRIKKEIIAIIINRSLRMDIVKIVIVVVIIIITIRIVNLYVVEGLLRVKNLKSRIVLEKILIKTLLI